MTKKFFASNVVLFALIGYAENSPMIPVNESPRDKKHLISENMTKRITPCKIATPERLTFPALLFMLKACSKIHPR
jgi:hypothetical protein